MHVDVQGHDLVALASLEEYICIVQSGVVEVPSSENVKLYKNQHSKLEMMAFLDQSQFTIRKIELQQNEENIYFYRD